MVYSSDLELTREFFNGLRHTVIGKTSHLNKAETLISQLDGKSGHPNLNAQSGNYLCEIAEHLSF